MTSLLRGGHQKVTLGDKGGGGSQKFQNKGDVLYGQPLSKIIEGSYFGKERLREFS